MRPWSGRLRVATRSASRLSASLSGLALILSACASATTVCLPKLRDVIEGPSLAGLQLDSPFPARLQPGSGVRGFHTRWSVMAWDPEKRDFTDVTGGVEAFPGLDEPLVIAFERSEEPGVPRQVLITARFDGDFKPRTIFYEASWPQDEGPQDYQAQLEFAGLQLGDFLGWSEHFGPVHRTQRPDIFVAMRYSMTDVQLGWVMRLVVRKTGPNRDVPSLDEATFLASDLGKLRHTFDVEADIDAAIARGDSRAARAAIPRGLPGGALGDALRARLDPAFAPLRRALAAVPEDEAASIGMRPPSSGIEPEVYGLTQLSIAVTDHGGSGADLPRDVRDELARRVGLFARARREQAQRTTDPAARGTREGLALLAEQFQSRVARHGELGFFTPSADRLVRIAHDWESGDLCRRAIAWQGTLAAASFRGGTVGELLGGIAAAARPALEAEALRRAREADGRHLPATAAAWWLLAEAVASGRKGLVTPVPCTDWAENPFGESARGKARDAIAGLWSDTVPCFLGESDQVLDHRWPTRSWLGLRLEDPMDRSLPRLDKVRVEDGPLQYDGTCRYQTRIVQVGPSGRRVQVGIVAAQTEADWQQAIESKRRQIAILEEWAQPSAGPLGTEVRGAAPVVRFTNMPGGTTLVEELDQQNTYRLGVGEAIEREAARIADANRRLPVLRHELLEMLRNGPGKASVVSEWVPDGGMATAEQEWPEWQGEATRLLTATAWSPDSTLARLGPFTATLRFDAVARSYDDVQKSDATSLSLQMAHRFGGYRTADDLLAGLAKSDANERRAALTELSATIVNARVDAWRRATDGAPADALDLEAAWRKWFFGAAGDQGPPFPVPLEVALTEPR